MSSPSPYGERLFEAMVLAGYAEADRQTLRKDARAKLAAALSISVQAVGMVLTGKTNAFTPDKSARAARFLKVDHFWLATGEGDPRPPGLSEEATAWARRYDRLDADGRAKFSAAIVLSQTGASDQAVEAKMPVTAKNGRAAHPEKQRS